ncbi:MAG: DoxX family protein [Verrucomicrobia bacterium]|nr:DoxX family protein [Verrucomicrobiota bacterium]
MRLETRTLAARTALVLLGGVYIAAGALKIADPMAFARSITDYDLLPDALVPAAAVLLPWWEVAAGALAVIGRWRAGALTLLAGMSAVFLAAGAATLARGLSPECGCFGPLGGRLGAVTLLVELTVLAAGVWLLRVETRKHEQV